MSNAAYTSGIPGVISVVREIVRIDCQQSTNRFGDVFFEEHLALVVAYARALAVEVGADVEIVELAGWLHDLAAVRDFETIPVHAVASAAAAKVILDRLGVPDETTRRVCGCVETHSNPVALDEGTPEQVIISNADVLSQVARPRYWCYYLHAVRGIGFQEAAAWFGDRIGPRWQRLLPAAQRLGAEPRTALAKLIAGPEMIPSALPKP